uniref:Uncharacterized protein n=1 Tax=Leersia perrieri TaxID=77586 RepID=A0A0D9WGV6_9ORYZ
MGRSEQLVAAAALPALLPTPPRSKMVPLLPTPCLIILPTSFASPSSAPKPGRADSVERWDAHKTRAGGETTPLPLTKRPAAGRGRSMSRADACDRWDSSKTSSTSPSRSSTSSSSLSLSSEPFRRGSSSSRSPARWSASRASSTERWDIHKKPRQQTGALDGENEISMPWYAEFAGPSTFMGRSEQLVTAAALPALLPTPPRSKMVPLLPTPCLIILPTSFASPSSAPKPGRTDSVERWDAHKTRAGGDTMTSPPPTTKRPADRGRGLCRADACDRWDSNKTSSTSPSRSSTPSSLSLSSEPFRRGCNGSRSPARSSSSSSRASSAERWDIHKKPRLQAGALDGEFAGTSFVSPPEPCMLPMPNRPSRPAPDAAEEQDGASAPYAVPHHPSYLLRVSPGRADSVERWDAHKTRAAGDTMTSPPPTTKRPADRGRGLCRADACDRWDSNKTSSTSPSRSSTSSSSSLSLWSEPFRRGSSSSSSRSPGRSSSSSSAERWDIHKKPRQQAGALDGEKEISMPLYAEFAGPSTFVSPPEPCMLPMPKFMGRSEQLVAAAALPALLPTPPRSKMVPLLPTPCLIILPTSFASPSSAPKPGRADAVERWDAHKTRAGGDTMTSPLPTTKRPAADRGRGVCRADACDRWDSNKTSSTSPSRSSTSSSSSLSLSSEPFRRGSSSSRSPARSSSTSSRASSAERWDIHKKPRLQSGALDGEKEISMPRYGEFAGQSFVSPPEPCMLPMPKFLLAH